MGAAKRRGAALETEKGGPPPRGRLSEDRASNSTNTNTETSIAPRSDTWTRRDRARAFVTAPPEERARPEWPAIRDRLRKRLPGTELVTDGWLSSCTGMVLVPGVQAEQVEVAVRMGMPVVVLTRSGLLTLDEARRPEFLFGHRKPDGRALVSALTAMGALPVRGHR